MLILYVRLARGEGKAWKMDYAEIGKPALEDMAVRSNLDGEYSWGGEFDWTQIEQELGVKSRDEITQPYLAIDHWSTLATW